MYEIKHMHVQICPHTLSTTMKRQVYVSTNGTSQNTMLYFETSTVLQVFQETGGSGNRTAARTVPTSPPRTLTRDVRRCVSSGRDTETWCHSLYSR